MSEKELKEKALLYHTQNENIERPGKVTVIPTKSTETQNDLALAYSPGVAYPCLEIEKEPNDAYKYTNKSNLVGIITNGTAVLGLGNIGTLASKPVMEGKSVLFKVFSGIDAFDIEVDSTNTFEFCNTVKNISPTFGGINLEDIKAPECFKIEKILKEELDIPVMHDDQHGTAIVSSAALLNALKITNRKIDEVKIIINGAGASALSSANMLITLGAKRKNIIMCDSKGVLNEKREKLNYYKQQFVNSTKKDTLAEVIKGAEVFLGFSVEGVLKPEMLKSMEDRPIVFAMANPNSEINYDIAKETRSDVIMGTGRSDFPNQINNVLAFPFIFRGALDVHSKDINEEMKKAVAIALAELAQEEVPQYILDSYKIKELKFGENYLIPKPLDKRLIVRASIAVAKAAIKTGVARKEIKDWGEYEKYLKNLNQRDCLLPSISNCFIG